MDRRRQPATHVGASGARPWAGEHDDEELSDPTVLTRGLAATRLVILIIGCGLGAGITLGITLWLALTALQSSV
jgi:hypothetical protein